MSQAFSLSLCAIGQYSRRLGNFYLRHWRMVVEKYYVYYGLRMPVAASNSSVSVSKMATTFGISSNAIEANDFFSV